MRNGFRPLWYIIENQQGHIAGATLFFPDDYKKRSLKSRLLGRNSAGYIGRTLILPAFRRQKFMVVALRALEQKAREQGLPLLQAFVATNNTASRGGLTIAGFSKNTLASLRRLPAERESGRLGTGRQLLVYHKKIRYPKRKNRG